MTIQENARIGLQALMAQKVRSFLTMLGIIFGVAAVVAMTSIGAGARQELLDAIKVMGVNNFIVRTSDLDGDELNTAIERNPKKMSFADVEALRTIVTEAQFIVPVRVYESKTQLPAVQSVNLVGTTPEYQNLQALTLVAGRFLKESDMTSRAPVIIISEKMKRELFPLSSGLGEQVKLLDQWYTIVGVVRPPVSGKSIPGMDMRDLHDDIYTPIKTMQARVAVSPESSPISEIVIQAPDENQVRITAAVVSRVIKRRHRDANDFEVIVPVELLKQSQKTQRIFNIVMGAIASISLLVGGIGIMNIMLSSVLERTREIGVRRAVGATRTNVVTQFLIEAVMLSVLGGFIGIVIGALMAWLITLFAGWTTVLGIKAVILAFGVSAGVGILFGWWPAKKAAEMDVINALRYE